MVKTTKKINAHGKLHNFYVPFTKVQESAGAKNSDGLHIKGIAISETTTVNGHKFLAEELSISAKTLCQKPVLVDHENSVYSIVGRTTDGCEYDGTSRCVMFDAIIKDEEMCDKIEKGLITSVSIGATVREMERCDETDGSYCYIARGINFVELSLVAVPADPNAGLQNALAESFSIEENKVNPEELKQMTEMTDKIADLSSQKEKLVAELAALEVEKLSLMKEKATAEVNAIKSTPSSKVEEKSADVPSQTKGQIAEAKETKTEAKMPFSLVQEEVVGAYGLELDYSNSKVLSR